MKISKLSFKTDYVDTEQGDGLGKYLAFYFYVDGNEIGKEEYNPANCDDILFSDEKTVFIQHCGCGCRECSALVANVKNLSDNIVEWNVNEYRYDAGAEVYHFAKAEYEKTMAQIYNAAYLEEAYATANDKTYFVKMEPDGYGLFWDDNKGSPDYGNLLGDEYDFKIHTEMDIEISIDILGVEDWLFEFDSQVLYPCEAGEITVEEINKTVDWKAFHRQGLAIAIEVKKLLPKNIVLKYSAPFEDRRDTLPDEVLIDDDEWYVKNVLEKLF